MNFMPRLYKDGDFVSLVALWRIAREKATPDFQRRNGYFFYEHIWYFQEHLPPENTVWVVDGDDGRPVAFMVLKDDFMDHLYAHPDHWRKGIGEGLIRFARSTCGSTPSKRASTSARSMRKRLCRYQTGHLPAA